MEKHMLFRAVFWIGLVSLLVPRGADLGAVGRVGDSAFESMALPQAANAAVSRTAQCRGTACATADILGDLQESVLRNLARIKADIEEQERARAARAG